MADQQAKDQGKRAKATAKDIGWVEGGIPSTTRNGHWTAIVEELRQNPGRTRAFENANSTTASYLKSHYGVNAGTRNNKDGRADMFLQYPAVEVVDEVTGEKTLVADEAKVAINMASAPSE